MDGRSARPSSDHGDGWFRIRVPVRFRDLDSMGHAHHTLPLIYLEEARAQFWAAIKGSAALDAIDYVMAEVTLRFHARILFPADVIAALAVRRVGGSSFTTDFEIRDEAGALLSSGTSVQVAYDYAASASRPLGADERTALQAWRGAALRSAGQNSSAMEAETSPMKPPST